MSSVLSYIGRRKPFWNCAMRSGLSGAMKYDDELLRDTVSATAPPENINKLFDDVLMYYCIRYCSSFTRRWVNHLNIIPGRERMNFVWSISRHAFLSELRTPIIPGMAVRCECDIQDIIFYVMKWTLVCRHSRVDVKLCSVCRYTLIFRTLFACLRFVPRSKILTTKSKSCVYICATIIGGVR